MVVNFDKQNLERRIRWLFISSPYPGKQKFGGQPTGLLYALSMLADRKEREYRDRTKVKDEIEVWCPDGVEDFENSSFKRELTDYLIGKRPQIVGVSTFSVSYQNAVHIKNLVKRISPETIVVFGGAHEDNFVKHYRERGRVDADFVIGGDGMFLLDALYKIVEENPNATVDEIKQQVSSQKDRFSQLAGAGVILYNVDGKLNYIATKSKPMQLDQLPIMPRYLLKDEDAISRQFSIFNGKKTAQVMVGQGCPYSCGFCSEGINKVWFDTDAPRSIEPARKLSHVDRELQELKAQGYEAIFFDDSTFFAKSKDYMQSLIDLLKKYHFEWGCQTTQNSVHHMTDLLPRMREAGLRYVYMGIEHYDGQIRDSFGKSIGGGDKFNGYSIENTIELLKNNDLKVGVSLTFGHPDPNSPNEETRETETTAKYAVDRTAELIERFPNIVGVSLNLVTYHPGTPISVRYEEEKKLGKIDYVGLPNKRHPFTSFEEGLGQHSNGMTSQLAQFILDYARQRIPSNKLWV